MAAPLRATRPNSRLWLGGALAAVLAAAGFAVTGLAAAPHPHNLILAHPVTFGQTLTRADVATAQAPAAKGLAVLPASAIDSVLGRPVVADLDAGTPLTDTLLGGTGAPAGLERVPLLLKEGRYAPGLSAGEPVAVYDAVGDTSNSTAAAQQQDPVLATIEAVEPSSGDQGSAVVVLVTDSGGAARLVGFPNPQIVERPASPTTQKGR